MAALGGSGVAVLACIDAIFALLSIATLTLVHAISALAYSSGLDKASALAIALIYASTHSKPLTATLALIHLAALAIPLQTN